MEQDGVSDVTRLEACNQVKNIVKLIKKLRIKYYFNFSKISDEDKKKYDILNDKLENISKNNDLVKFKTVLIQEINDKYQKQDTTEFRENGIEPNKILQACYGAIDVQKDAISKGKITQAIKCQKLLKEYQQNLNSDKFKELIINYKREKFAELIETNEDVEKKEQEWVKSLKNMYNEKHAYNRKEIDEIFKNAINFG